MDNKICAMLILCLLFAGGCRKQETVTPAAEMTAKPDTSVTGTSGGERNSPEPDSGPSAIQLERPVRQKEEDTKEEVREIHREDGSEAFLAVRKGGWLVPEDFVIGPLQLESTDNEEEAALLALAAGFFDNLARGTLKEDLVAKDWRSPMKESLGMYIDEGLLPENVRLGALMLNGAGSAHCNVRLYAGTGISAGEIYFLKEGNTWFITDLQINLSLLRQEYAPDPEPYEPGIYRYLETF